MNLEEEIKLLKDCIRVILDHVNDLLNRVKALEEKTQERAFNDD